MVMVGFLGILQAWSGVLIHKTDTVPFGSWHLGMYQAIATPSANCLAYHCAGVC